MTAGDPEIRARPPRREPRRVGIDQTLERLRSMILSGELAPGTVVSQLALAKQLGVSTTPLREAMRQLQAEGLLEAELNRRPRVPDLDIDTMHAVYATRILLESLAVSLTVPTITEPDLDALRQLLLVMAGLTLDGDLDAWEEVHEDFHRRLVAGVPDAMTPALSSVFERSERFRKLSLLRDQPRGWSVGQEEHERIVNACARRDAVGAARELAAHLARTAIGLSAAYAPEVDPAPIRIAVGLITAGAPVPATAGFEG